MSSIWKRLQSVRRIQERQALRSLREATIAREKKIASIREINLERTQLERWRQNLLSANSNAYANGVVDRLTLRATRTHLCYLADIELSILLRRLEAEIDLADATHARDAAQQAYRRISGKRTLIDEVMLELQAGQRRRNDLLEEDRGGELFINRLYAGHGAR